MTATDIVTHFFLLLMETSNSSKRIEELMMLSWHLGGDTLSRRTPTKHLSKVMLEFPRYFLSVFYKGGLRMTFRLIPASRNMMLWFAQLLAPDLVIRLQVL